MSPLTTRSGPYPSVWAMLTLFQHPDNHRTPPNILFTHQTPYARSGVDLNSRWLLEFPGLGGVQALLTTDMGVTGGGERGAVIVCEEGDIAIECEWDLHGSTYTLSLSSSAVSCLVLCTPERSGLR